MKYAGFFLAAALIFIFGSTGYNKFFIERPRLKMIADNKDALGKKANDVLTCLTTGTLPGCLEPFLGPTMKKTMTPELLDITAGKLRSGVGNFTGGAPVDSSFAVHGNTISFTIDANFEKDPVAKADFTFARHGKDFLLERYEARSPRLAEVKIMPEAPVPVEEPAVPAGALEPK